MQVPPARPSPDPPEPDDAAPADSRAGGRGSSPRGQDARGAGDGRDAGRAPPSDLLAPGQPLSRIERAQIKLVRASLRPGRLDRTIRSLQRSVGQWWILAATASLRHIHGVDRLPGWKRGGSVVVVANHRSFFDLYVITAELVSRGLPHRILFPVRSNFFYDHPLGAFVNGTMSFFAMYPPIFRDRRRAALNLAALDEVSSLLGRGGFFVGLHPEGTRKKDDDPYTLLPAQSGIGRILHGALAGEAPVDVIPVFVNGLENDLVAQVAGGLTRRGRPIHVVFGAPIDFGSMARAAPSPRAYRQIAQTCADAIATLGAEERRLRG